MDAEWISRYGCRVDIQVQIKSGYPGTDLRVDIQVWMQSGYPGINKIFSAFSGDICVHRA